MIPLTAREKFILAIEYVELVEHWLQHPEEYARLREQIKENLSRELSAIRHTPSHE